MANTPSKPNPLHGKPETKEVSMPGSGPAPDMKPPEDTDNAHVPENIRAEMTEGKRALGMLEDRIKEEMEAGKRAISHK